MVYTMICNNLHTYTNTGVWEAGIRENQNQGTGNCLFYWDM